MPVPSEGSGNTATPAPPKPPGPTPPGGGGQPKPPAQAPPANTPQNIARWWPLINEMATRYRIDPRLLVAIITVESAGNPNAVGDGGNSHGLVQIYLKAHPSVTAAQAKDPRFAIDWAARKIRGFLNAHPNAPVEAVLLQHNNPSAARKLARGEITLAEANARSGTGRYVTETMAVYSRTSGTGGGAGAPAGAAYTGTSGGAAPGGGGTGANAAPPNVANMTDAQILDIARKRYGYYAYFLDNPEIRRVLIIAVRNGWGDAEVQGEIVKTEWWKKTSQSARQWQYLVRSDGAEAKRQTDARHAEVRAAAQRAGVILGEAEYREIAKKSLENGWSSLEIQNAIAAKFDLEPGEDPQGQAAASITEMRALAGQYNVDLSDATLESWVRQQLAGTRTLEDFRAYLIDVAKGAYAGNEAIWNALDRGQTIRQIVDPLGQQAARLLGLDPNMVDWNDPKWRRFLHTYDEKAKTFRPMTLDEVRREVRTNQAYGYLNTAGGKAEAAEFASQLASRLGYV